MPVSPSDDSKIRSQLAKLEEDANVLAGTESVWALQEPEQTSFHILKSKFMTLLQFVGGNTANNSLTELKDVGANVNALSPRDARNLAGMIMGFKAMYEQGLVDTRSETEQVEVKSSNGVTIFLSHSNHDDAIASVLVEQLNKSLASVKHRIFKAPDGIGAGEDWFPTVISELNQANIMILLLTPHSVVSGWVHFEYGYFWSKLQGKSIYLLKVPQTEIKSPLDVKQVKLVTERKQFENFLQRLGDEVGITANVDMGFDFDLLLNAINKVSFVNSTASGEDAKEILIDFMRYEYKGMWLQYDNLDREKSLKIGSSKDYLKLIVEGDEELDWEVVKESELGIRFKRRATVVSSSRYA